MQRGGLLIWTVFLLLAAFAVPIVFLMGLVWAPEDRSWIQSVLIVAFAGLMALLLVIVIEEIRKTARRWNSPMYYPAIWTSVTGLFAAWFVLLVPSRPWDWTDTACDSNGICTTTHHFEAFGLILTLFFGVLIFGPFLRSAFDLYFAWRIPPARFVYRWRRHHP